MGKQALHDRGDEHRQEHEHVTPEMLIKSRNRFEERNHADFSRGNRMRFKFVFSVFFLGRRIRFLCLRFSFD